MTANQEKGGGFLSKGKVRTGSGLHSGGCRERSERFVFRIKKAKERASYFLSSTGVQTGRERGIIKEKKGRLSNGGKVDRILEKGRLTHGKWKTA